MHPSSPSDTPPLRPFTLATRGPARDLQEDAEARLLAQEEERRWARSMGIDTSITTVAGRTICNAPCTVTITTGGPKNPDQKTEKGIDEQLDDNTGGGAGPPQG